MENKTPIGFYIWARRPDFGRYGFLNRKRINTAMKHASELFEGVEEYGVIPVYSWDGHDAAQNAARGELDGLKDTAHWLLHP